MWALESAPLHWLSCKQVLTLCIITMLIGGENPPQKTVQERETDIKLQLITHKIQNVNCEY